MIRSLILALAALAVLAGCTKQQLTQAETNANAALNAVTLACAGAEKAKTDAAAQLKGGAAGTVAGIGSYIDGACGTSAAIIKVAQDPTTVAWLNGMAETITAATASPAAATAPVPVGTPAKAGA